MQPRKAREAVQRIPRHELKYYLNPADVIALRPTLKALLHLDPNADAQGNYAIRSLYFDDVYNAAYLNKVAGNETRDKYRIRVYNGSDKKILLERKRKLGQLIDKTTVPITRRLCDQLAKGDPTGLDGASHPLLQDMFRLMRTQLLRPVVLVDYVREAYVHPAQHVRLTFDKQLRTGLMRTDLFDPGITTISPLDEDVVIFEVKFDHYLPQYINNVLSRINAPRMAISKYTLCRRFEPI